MTQKNLITLITLLICCIGLGACKEKGKDNEPPVEVQLRIPESVELQVGDTHQLDVKVSPKETKVTFESTNTQVVTVSEVGLLTALAEGQAEVKATAGDVTKVCKVSVQKQINIDKSRYLGLDASADDQKYFAPIYIPKEEDFTANNLLHFKVAVSPYGWIYQPQGAKADKMLYYFASPRKLDDNGKEMPEEAQFCMDALIYNYAVPGTPLHIKLIPNKHYPKDYMVDPDSFTDPKDLDVQEELLEIVKHYGFTEDAHFTKLSGDSAYEAYNTKFDPKQPLRGVMFTEKEDDAYELTFQISYVRR